MDTFGMSTKNFANTDKLFGTSNMSTKLRNSITSAKLISAGSGRNLTNAPGTPGTPGNTGMMNSRSSGSILSQSGRF
jgi:hypothetical protein